MRRITTLLLGLALLGQSTAGWAQSNSQAQSNSKESGPQQVGYGAGSVLGTLVYAPVKASFCILGAISSGFAYPIAGAKTAGDIAGATCKGTWVITPDTLKGKEQVKFVGDSS